MDIDDAMHRVREWPEKIRCIHVHPHQLEQRPPAMHVPPEASLAPLENIRRHWISANYEALDIDSGRIVFGYACRDCCDPKDLWSELEPSDLDYLRKLRGKTT